MDTALLDTDILTEVLKQKAANVVQHVWKQTAAQTFLRRVLFAKPLAERIAMALAIKEQLKRRDTSAYDIDRPSLIEKSMKIFDEDGIREMMRELRDFV